MKAEQEEKRTGIRKLAVGYLAGFLIGIGILFLISGVRGQDVQVYCQAGAGAASGNNPYLTSEIHTFLSWNYLPIYLPLARLLCSPPLDLWSNYVLIYTFLIVLSSLAWCSGEGWGKAVFISLCIFLGFGWTLYSGNWVVIEFLLISAGFGLVKRHRWEAAAAVLGLNASLKLIPVFYLSLFAFLPQDRSTRFRSMATGLSAFLAPLLLSFLLYPKIMPTFFLQLTGNIPNQHNPLQENGGFYNPSIAFLITAVLQLDLQEWNLPISILTGLTGLGLLFLYFRKNTPTPENPPDKLFAFGFILLFLFLPREKPYSYLLLAPAVTWLIEGERRIRQLADGLVAILVPAVFMIADKRLRIAGLGTDSWYLAFLDCGQILSLLILTIIFYRRHSKGET